MERRINITETELRRIISETVHRALAESFGGDGYDAYVVVDEASGEIIGNYATSDREEAISDAEDMARGGGRYMVLGCVGNEYSFDDVVYDTDPDGPSYRF